MSYEKISLEIIGIKYLVDGIRIYFEEVFKNDGINNIVFKLSFKNKYFYIRRWGGKGKEDLI